MKRISLLILTLLTLFFANTAYAQVSTQTWIFQAGTIKPANSSWTETLPYLGGGGTQVVCATNAGLLQAGGCGGGGGGGGVATSSLTATYPIVVTPSSSTINFSLVNMATTSATCSGTVSCSPFTVIGLSPVTLTGSGLTSDPNWIETNGYLTPTTTVGILVNASSTIGNNTQTGGLTISGGSTTTLNAYFASNVGVGTTTPGSLLSLNNIANFTAATSTFYSTGGINLAAGCYAIANNCLSLGNLGLTGTTGQVPYFNGTNTAIGTSSLFIVSDGSVGVNTNTTNLGLFQIGGTFTTAKPALFSESATLSSSQTNTDYGVLAQPSFNPTGASLTTAEGFAIDPTISSTTVNVSSYNGLFVQPLLTNAYTGTITSAYDINIAPIIFANGKLTDNVTNYQGIRIQPWTSGDGITSGTVTNAGLLVNTAIASTSAGGTINNYGVDIGVPAGAPNGGTTNDYGLFIAGNGGSSANGGTENHYSLYDQSTANSYFAGSVGIGTTNPTATLDVNGFINTNQASGYKQAGNTILSASTTAQTTFVGYQAGNAETVSNNTGNTALGYDALFTATSSESNVAIGRNALFHLNDTNGGLYEGANTAVGNSALAADTFGTRNIAIGGNALLADTIGSNNTAIGNFSLYQSTTGNLNLALGEYSLGANVSGSGNVALGTYAGFDASFGSNPNNNSVIDTNSLFIGYNATRDGSLVASTTVLTNANAIGENARVACSNCMVLGASGTNVGIGTTSPGSLLSINNLVNFTAATSTFYSTGGINLTSGCFAINGTCISGGTGGSGTVTSVATTYPVTGGTFTTSGTIALAFGTTTANAWNALNTFTNSTSTLLTAGTFWDTNITSAVAVFDANHKETAATTQTCTNQFMRAMSAAYSVTCNAVSLTADVTGTLPVGNGGTGATTYTAGQILYGDGTLALGSNSALTFATTTNTLLTNEASTTAFTNFGQAYFGGTGTTTILSSGFLGIASSTPWSSLVVSGSIVVPEASSTAKSTTAALQVDFKSQQTEKAEMNANTTVDLFDNAIPGDTQKVILCQDGTGSRTVTWASSSTLIWAGHTNPTMTATANECDVYSFIVTGATGTPEVFGAATQIF